MLVGNPVMHHLLLGIDPTPLGGAPFALAVDEPVRLPARELGLPVQRARVPTSCRASPATSAPTPPASILSEGPHLGDEVNLIVDVGTNAEIVLGNRDRLLAASSPTGPAFEGAQISCGQRAAPGAIERVRIDPRDARAARPRDRVRRLVGRAGVRGHVSVDRRLRLRDHRGDRRAPPRRRDHDRRDDRRRAAPRARRASWPTDAPSRTCSGGRAASCASRRTTSAQIQLAKAALHAGCTLLMERYGIETVDRIRLAGAFGTHIDPVHALVLGLVPDCDPRAGHCRRERRRHGRADRAPEPRRAQREIEEVVRRVEKIETAVEPRFQEHFVNAMAIPHDADPYAALCARRSRLPGAQDRTDTSAPTRRGADRERKPA